MILAPVLRTYVPLHEITNTSTTCCLSTHQYSMHHMFWCTFSEPSNMSGSTKCIIDQHCRIKIQTISAPRFVHRIWTRILWLLSIIDDTFFFFLVQMKTNWVTKKQKSSLGDFIIIIIIEFDSQTSVFRKCCQSSLWNVPSG